MPSSIVADAGAPVAPGVAGHAGRPGFLRLFARNRTALLGALLVVFFVLLAILGPFLTPYDPDKPNLPLRLQGPSPAYPFGTDEVGRDILTRIAHGARFSLIMGVVAMSISAFLGVPMGLLGGYRGGRWDTGVMRGVDVLMTLPSIVLSIAIVSVMGPGVVSVIVAVGITSTPAFARLTRAVALTLRDQDFVSAARVIGASDARILRLHIFPNTLPPLIVQASLGVGTTILTASALGVLGLGVQPPTPEWGAMLSRARTYLSVAPHMVLFPGLAIALLVLGFNLLGDGLR
ncbi:MAG TPA: ABC transporter permease, partial [Chloroflexota bacterium]|nr:ABC transporter permease [Chloroflexota bacterium]